MNSVVSRINTEGCTVYRWEYPNSRAIRNVANALIGIWLISILVGLMNSISIFLLRTETRPPLFFAVGWSVLSLIGIVFTVAAIYYVGRRSRPETLTFTISSFSYDPGNCSPIVYALHLNFFEMASPFVLLYSIIRNKRLIELSKDTMKGFVLDQIGQRQRLHFDNGSDRIEIGRFLSEPDREWLYSEVREWGKT